MENLKVRNIYDREGHTEEIIMGESEIKKAVEKWLEDNSFEDVLKKEGIFRNSQSFGNSNSIVIDTRDGKISHSYNQQNQMSPDCPFFIELVRLQEIDFSDSECCEGSEMIVEASAEEISKSTDLGNDIDELEVKKLENGKYEISWWNNQDYIKAQDFVEKLMGESWGEWKSDYEDYLLEDVDQTITWQDEVMGYYNQLRIEL